MNWEAIGAVGEVLGAIGVIVTLAYLAVQIRRNTTAMRAESSRSSAQATGAASIAIAQDGELARIFNQGLHDQSSLTPEERTRFAFLLGTIIAPASTSYNEVALGVIPEEWLDNQRDTLRRFLHQPGGAEWWSQFKGGFPPPFREFVDREIVPGSPGTADVDTTDT